MPPLPDKFTRFIAKHHVLTLATVSGGEPWCAHVFYVWMPERNLFVFTTETSTRHGAEMEAGSPVAAGIALETRTVGRLQGLQIEGRVRRPEGGRGSEIRRVGENVENGEEGGSGGGSEAGEARRAYVRRFPYAAVAGLSLWVLEPSLMKLTDNTLGFGKKLIWMNK